MLECYAGIFNERIEQDIKGTSLVLEHLGDGSVIDYQIEMLNNNETEGIIKPLSYVKNGKTELWYDISGYTNLEKYINENKITGEMVSKLVVKISEIILDSNKLFLDESNFMLEKEYLYVDSDMNPHILYIPFSDFKCGLDDGFSRIFKAVSKKVEITTGVGDMLQILSREFDNEKINFKKLKEEALKFKKTGTASPQAPANIPMPSPKPVAPVNDVREQPLQKVNTADAKPQQEKQVLKENDSFIRRREDVVIKKKDAAKENNKNGKQTEMNGNLVKIIILQIALLAIIAGLVVSGVKDSLDVTQQIGVIILLAAIDYLVVKKGMPNADGKNGKQTAEGKKNKVGSAGKKKEKKSKDTVKDKKNALKAENDFNFKKVAANETDTDFIGEDESTVILAANGNAYLVGNGGSDSGQIVITSNPFNIGKSSQGNDFICSDKHVSRNHAQILSSNGEYFIMDLSSTNGTWLNGTKLEANMQYPLNNGDVITFAKSEYSFYLQ